MAKPAEVRHPGQPKTGGKSFAPDVLFMLLTAELAGQRGQYGLALEGYLEAAKRVRDPRFAERAAMIALYLKDFRRFDEAVKIWLAQDANNLTVRKFALLSALKAGNKNQATDHMVMLLDNDAAGFEKAVIELKPVLQKEGKSGLLLDVLDELARLRPQQAMLFFTDAMLAAQLNYLDRAKSKIGQALTLRPEWEKALVLKAQLAVLSGDLQSAVNVLQDAAQKFPEDRKISSMLAQILVKTKAYGRAITVYETMVKADPKDYESRFSLGLVNLQQAHLDEAEALFTGLLPEQDWQAQASFYLGKLEEQRGEVSAALSWYDKVGDARLQFEAGVAAVSLLGKEKRFAEAERRVVALATKFPKHRQRLMLLRAELLGRQRDYQKAFDLLSEGLKDTPDDKDLLYSRALMAEHLGKLELLEADLKKILAKQPDNTEALNALGYTLASKTRRYQEAESYLLRALSLAPQEPVILDSYGWLLFKQGQLGKALDYLQRAYDKQPETEIAAHLVEVLWLSGDQARAKSVFAEANKKHPDDEYLQEVKRRLWKGSE